MIIFQPFIMLLLLRITAFLLWIKRQSIYVYTLVYLRQT